MNRVEAQTAMQSVHTCTQCIGQCAIAELDWTEVCGEVGGEL